MARTMESTMCKHVGLRGGCRVAVTWAGHRIPIPPQLPELEQARSSQMLEKAVPSRHLRVQEKQ